MQCSIPCRFIPIQPRGLAVLLLLSLLLQSSGWVTTFARPPLPALETTVQRGHLIRRRCARQRWSRFPARSFIVHGGLRLLARWGLLVVLLHTSGWITYTSWSWSVLLVPLAQMLHALWVLGIPASAAAFRARRVSADLQRLYQLTLVVLVFSFLLQALSWVHPGPGGLVVPFAGIKLIDMLLVALRLT